MDYICHHGVKGMKWGVRKDPQRVGQPDRFKRTKWNALAVMKARKDFKRSQNKNPDAINQIKSDNIKRMHRTTSRKGMYAAYAKGKKAVMQGELLQAGYSEESAAAGAEWMYKHNWNFTWADGNDYVKAK